jgi:hypothetical protein
MVSSRRTEAAVHSCDADVLLSTEAMKQMRIQQAIKAIID